MGEFKFMMLHRVYASRLGGGLSSRREHLLKIYQGAASCMYCLECWEDKKESCAVRSSGRFGKAGGYEEQKSEHQ